jgi:hypothetical protein
MSKPGRARQIVQGLAALALLVGLIALAGYGLLRVGGGLAGAIGGAIAALAVALVSKAFEHQKQQDAAIAEKKREVYKRLLGPWEHLMVDLKAGKEGAELGKGLDLAAVYSSAFDVVLYGSENVVERYVQWRSPDAERDAIDTLRSMAALLVAMREDVTGKKTALSVEAVLGTFMNFKDEERFLIRMREYVATHPEAQEKLRQVLAQPQKQAPSTDAKNV